MSLRDDLLEKETNLWSGGADAYRHTLDDNCLVAFTRSAGVTSREAIAGQVGEMRCDGGWKLMFHQQTPCKD